MNKTRFIKGIGEINVKDIDHHRNGISGVGFDVVTFTQRNGNKKENMVAILFSTDESGYCAVFDTDLLGNGNIKFGENSWRGDNYESELRKVVTENLDEYYAEMYKERQKNVTP